MTKLTRQFQTLTLTGILFLIAAKTVLAERMPDWDDDRGDVPGWAIASGAACVLATLVYAAYNAVISKWIAKIH